MPRGVYRRPWQSEPPEPKRLTANPKRASVIRNPATGETYTPTSQEGRKCLKRLKS